MASPLQAGERRARPWSLGNGQGRRAAPGPAWRPGLAARGLGPRPGPALRRTSARAAFAGLPCCAGRSLGEGVGAGGDGLVRGEAQLGASKCSAQALNCGLCCRAPARGVGLGAGGSAASVRATRKGASGTSAVKRGRGAGSGGERVV